MVSVLRHMQHQVHTTCTANQNSMKPISQSTCCQAQVPCTIRFMPSCIASVHSKLEPARDGRAGIASKQYKCERGFSPSRGSRHAHTAIQAFTSHHTFIQACTSHHTFIQAFTSHSHTGMHLTHSYRHARNIQHAVCCMHMIPCACQAVALALRRGVFISLPGF